MKASLLVVIGVMNLGEVHGIFRWRGILKEIAYSLEPR